MKKRIALISTSALLLLFSCAKEVQQERINKYDQKYEGSRNYNISYSHTVVRDDHENGNGLLEAGENNVELEVHFHNSGPDVFLIEDATVKTLSSAFELQLTFETFFVDYNNSYSKVYMGDTPNGVYMGKSTDTLEINYLEPGETDYVLIKVDALAEVAPLIDFSITFYEWGGDRNAVTLNWDLETH